MDHIQGTRKISQGQAGPLSQHGGQSRALRDALVYYADRYGSGSTSASARRGCAPPARPVPSLPAGRAADAGTPHSRHHRRSRSGNHRYAVRGVALPSRGSCAAPRHRFRTGNMTTRSALRSRMNTVLTSAATHALATDDSRGSPAAFRGCGSPGRSSRSGVANPDIVRGRPAGHVASLEISVKAARSGFIPTAVADKAGYRRWHRCGRCSASTDASSITLS